MKFKVDENMPVDLGSMLRQQGHDAVDVREEGLSGADDPPILAAATKERRILLTFDLDFADIRRYPPGSHAGIVVFRLGDQRWRTLEKPAMRLLESSGLRSFANGLAIVDEVRVRWKRSRRK